MTRPLLGAAALLLSLAACKTVPSPFAPSGAPPPPVRLAFRPPADRRVTEQHVTQVTSAQQGRTTRERVELTTVSRFSRRPDGTWLLEQSTPRARQLRDDQPVDTALADVVTRYALQLLLAADGSFVRVLNPDAPGEVLRAAVLDPEALQQLEPFFGREGVEVRARTEWEAARGGLFARNLTPGQRLYTLESVVAGGRERFVAVERTVAGTLLTDHGDALVLSLRCVGEPPAELAQQLAAREARLEPGATCEGEQVVVAASGLPVRHALTVRMKEQDAEWTVQQTSTLTRVE